MALQFIKKQERYICKSAIQNDPRAFRFVIKQDEELCKLAIELDPRNIRFVKEKTPLLCKLAIDTNPFAIFEIEMPSVELCAYAVMQDLRTIGAVNNYKLASPWKEFFEHNRLMAMMKFGDKMLKDGKDTWSYNGMMYAPGLGIPEY